MICLVVLLYDAHLTSEWPRQSCDGVPAVAQQLLKIFPRRDRPYDLIQNFFSMIDPFWDEHGFVSCDVSLLVAWKWRTCDCGTTAFFCQPLQNNFCINFESNYLFIGDTNYHVFYS